MHQNKRIRRTVNIRGVGLVEVVTVTGLAQIIGKSRITVLRYEHSNIFPLAPLKMGTKRYYPVSLAQKLAPLVAKLPSNRKPDPELIVAINKLFKDERNKLCQQK